MPLSLLCWNVLADVHINEDWYPGVPRADLRGALRRERLGWQASERINRSKQRPA